MNSDLSRRSSSVWFHFGPLKIRQGLTHVPIFSFLKSLRPLYCLIPSSTMSSNSFSKTRPRIKLSGRFLEVDPKKNREQSFFSDKLKFFFFIIIQSLIRWFADLLIFATYYCNELVSSNGVISLLRVRTLQSGFFKWYRSLRACFTSPEHFRPSIKRVCLTFSLICGSRASRIFLPLCVVGFLLKS